MRNLQDGLMTSSRSYEVIKRGTVRSMDFRPPANLQSEGEDNEDIERVYFREQENVLTPQINPQCQRRAGARTNIGRESRLALSQLSISTASNPPESSTDHPLLYPTPVQSSLQLPGVQCRSSAGGRNALSVHIQEAKDDAQSR